MAIGQKGSLERMEEHQVGISLGYHSSRMWHKDLGSKVEKYLITCGWWEGAAFHCWSQSRGGFPAGALIHTHTHIPGSIMIGCSPSSALPQLPALRRNQDQTSMTRRASWAWLGQGLGRTQIQIVSHREDPSRVSFSPPVWPCFVF